jgi:DNA repair photolyase
MNRIREGYAVVRNPFNALMVSRIDLTPGNVDAIVFWTRNAGPMLPDLNELNERGFRYYFQYTLTAYPRMLEPRLPSPSKAVATFKELSRAVGPDRVVWRFDPIVVSSITPEDWICSNFEELASNLQGFTRSVVISFADFYVKVARNLRRATAATGIAFRDAHEEPEILLRMASRLADAAHGHGMRISSCAEGLDLSGMGIENGKCVSDELISSLFNIDLTAPKDRYQRKACGCVESKDIGRYDTCTHGCVYCYANSGGKAAIGNYAAHDPEEEAL